MHKWSVETPLPEVQRSEGSECGRVFLLQMFYTGPAFNTDVRSTYMEPAALNQTSTMLGLLSN